MVLDKLVDSTALNAQLTSIANAIRSKTGKSDTMTINEMPTEINNISAGGEMITGIFELSNGAKTITIPECIGYDNIVFIYFYNAYSASISSNYQVLLCSYINGQGYGISLASGSGWLISSTPTWDKTTGALYCGFAGSYYGFKTTYPYKYIAWNN